MISVCPCVFFFWLQHFAASGFPCPKLRNPADHFLRAVNSDFDRVKMGVQGSFKIRVRRNDFKFHTHIIEADCLKIVWRLFSFLLYPPLFLLCFFYNTFFGIPTKLLQEIEAQRVDPLDKMMASQVVKILTDSYLNSHYYLLALSRMHEINKIVSVEI